MREYPSFYKIPRVLKVRSIHTAFQKNYDENFYYAGETHNFWELVYVDSGRASVAKGERIFSLGGGDMVFHPPMEFHRLWSEGEPFSALILSFAAEVDALKPLSEGIFTLERSQQKALHTLLAEIDEAFEKDGVIIRGAKGGTVAVQKAVNRLELFLLDVLEMKSNKKSVKTGSAKDFSRVVEMMNEHIEENLSVPDLARLCNLSVSNLKKIVKKYAGTGVNKHFLQLKMIRAISMLENGQNVSEVSEELGFSSQNYFSFVFKRETGKCPKEFKPA